MRIHFGTTSTTTKMGKGKQGGEKKQNERKRRGERDGGETASALMRSGI